MIRSSIFFRHLALIFLTALTVPPVRAAEISAGTDKLFSAALRAARPGDVIRLGEGPYGGGFWGEGLSGSEGKPIRIVGPASDRPAVFDSPDSTILQIVRAKFIEVENLHIRRSGGHGLSFDDGGQPNFPCNHLAIRHCRFDDVGAKGGSCSIKMAGVSDFTVSDCTFRGWGAAGDAVDGVGCRKGVVERCTFLPERGSVAVQFKGGSEDVMIHGCRFDDLSDAAINIGGSTDMNLFRPKPQGFEARRITVEGNVFIGCVCAAAFCAADGGDVRFNTVYKPRKWAFRILQTNPNPGFVPCRGGRISDNIVVFDSTHWFEGGINVGEGTAPDTFTFSGNAWYCVDHPERSAPRLPTLETNGIIGKAPQFTDPAANDFNLLDPSPLKGKGHTGLPKKP